METEKRVKRAIERLESLRDTWGITKLKMAKRVGVSKQTYTNWTTGRHQPDLEGWFKIQDFLGGD